MAKISVELELTKAKALFDRLRDLGGGALDLALSDVGEYLLRSTRDRATKEISPEGKPWTALSPRYQRRKAKQRPGLPKLKLDFHMLGDQLSWQVEGNDLLLGTAAKYGAIHQFGGAIARPARSTHVYFRQDKRSGEVGNRFVPKGKSNFAQRATLPAYTINMPARPWLGLSQADETEVLAILASHVDRLMATGGAGVSGGSTA